MDVVGRLDRDTGKVVEYPFRGEFATRLLHGRQGPDCLHGAGSLAAGSIFGFENLSLPSIPTLLWAASVPGLFLFLRTRPNLLRRVWRVGYFMGQYSDHCVSIATEYAHSHPRAARSIGAGAMVAVAGVGTLHPFSSLFAVAFWGLSRLPIRLSKSH
jgi:hypothetical protein